MTETQVHSVIDLNLRLFLTQVSDLDFEVEFIV